MGDLVSKKSTIFQPVSTVYLAIFKEIFEFVKLHLHNVKFNVIFNNNILMVADILMMTKCLPWLAIIRIFWYNL